MKGLAGFLLLAIPRIGFLYAASTGIMDEWSAEVGADMLIIFFPSMSVFLAVTDISPTSMLTTGILVNVMVGLAIDVGILFMVRWLWSDK